MIRRHALALFIWLNGTSAFAQNTLRISLKDGTPIDIPIELIDSATFITTEIEPQQDASIVGVWYWESQEQGYSETLTFYADGRFTCIDHYFAYGFDSSTYGTYMLFGSMLTLISNGYGYNRFNQWMVTELTDKKLTVMTKMGSFTYTRQKNTN